METIDLDLFAGPGGWCEAARALGMRPLGIERDDSACATRRAAGHETLQADVAALEAATFAAVRGLIGSPPCKLYSAAGTGIGRLVIDILAAAIPRLLAGEDCRQEVRNRIHPVALGRRQAENEDRDEAKRWTAGRVEAAARSDAFEASLVLEPARYIAGIGGSLEWVALEQVPAVLPLWRVYAAELRKLGFSTWTGELNAADYGVPQVRKRAILIASRVHRVSRPEPTHYDPKRGMQLWGTPWVTMAAALGWGADQRPSVAVTAGGTAAGGAEPFGHRGRDALEAERDAGRWMLRRRRGASVDRRDHPGGEPAPTITSAGGKAGANLSWVRERPATTVQGDPRIGRPGHKDRDMGESQFALDSVQCTVEELAALQSFPAGYPWQGTKTRRHEQVGNAVPPLLAEHVLTMATGISRMEAAA